MTFRQASINRMSAKAFAAVNEKAFAHFPLVQDLERLLQGDQALALVSQVGRDGPDIHEESGLALEEVEIGPEVELGAAAAFAVNVNLGVVGKVKLEDRGDLVAPGQEEVRSA